MRRLWMKFLAYWRLDLDAVCEMSRGMGPVDYHDYPDTESGTPFHFVSDRCKRCGKEFTM